LWTFPRLPHRVLHPDIRPQATLQTGLKWLNSIGLGRLGQDYVSNWDIAPACCLITQIIENKDIYFPKIA
ncbi:MAG: hypothetical protein WCA99_03045, partial [Candidatus Sulfotelmatobacter sp.]